MARLYVLVYPFAMKYLIVLGIVLLIARVDFVLSLFDKAGQSLGSRSQNVVISDSKSDREVIPLGDDGNLKQTPKKTFLALLESFAAVPERSVSEKVVAYLKSHPTLLNDKLDKDFEAHIFAFRDFLHQNNPEAVNLLIELMSIVRGENLDMMKRFFALWMDINMDHFLRAYSRAKDPNCSIALTFGDPIPEEEIINEYFEREAALTEFLKQAVIEPQMKILATNCHLMLSTHLAKVAPKPAEVPRESSDVPAGDTGTTP